MRVHDQLQVCERVLDLLALVKAHAADDLVGHAFAHQRVFNRAGLRVGPIEDRHQGVHVFGPVLLDRSRDEVGFLELVVPAVVDDPGASLAIGPEPFVLAIPVLADDGRCGVEDGLRRSIVLLEADDLGFAEVLLEIEDVPQVGAAPFVDRLIGIADDGDVAVDLGEPADEHVLRTIGVLVLVHHDVLELARVELAGLFGGFDELDRLQQKVVEIEGVRVLQCGEVPLVDLGNLLVADVPAAAQALRSFHAVLGLADSRQGGTRRHQLVVDAELALRLFDDGDLVGRVVDHEIARESDLRRLAAQQTRAERVKRREPHTARCSADERLDALPHFLRRLVGERDREHLIRIRMPVTDEVCDPVSDDASLAGARAREDEHGPIAMKHGFALLGVQLFEEIHGGES